jgi:hypothetical protein
MNVANITETATIHGLTAGLTMGEVSGISRQPIAVEIGSGFDERA